MKDPCVFMNRTPVKRIACLVAAMLLLVPCLLFAASAADPAGGRVVVYDAPEGVAVCDDYLVEVSDGGEWIRVPVFAAGVTRGRRTCTETFFASVDLDGSMRVRVKPKRPFSSAQIRPLYDGISGTAEDGVLSFEVSGPCQLSVEFDGDVMHNLQLFVNDIPADTPDPADPDVIFFDAGLHTAENDSRISGRDGIPILYVHSGQTVWLAGGAVVKSRILPDRGAHDVTVGGRGILDLYDWNTPEGTDESITQAFGRRIFGIEAIDVTSLAVSGIIFRNATAYTVCGQNVSGAKFENLKLFSCSDFSDGIDLMSSEDIEIRDSYIRSNDDGIVASGTCWSAVGPSRGWLVENCVFLTDCGHSVYIGGIGSNDEICDMRFRDIDILDDYEESSYYWGAIGVNSCDGNLVHDLSFEDIRIERVTKGEPIRLTVRNNYEREDTPGRGITDVVFRNVTVGSSGEKSSIKGLADAKISNVLFDNFVFEGTTIGPMNYRKAFHQVENGENVRFTAEYEGAFGRLLNFFVQLLNRILDLFRV